MKYNRWKSNYENISFWYNWLSLKKICTESLQNVETDVASSTFWIVAFFISLLINTVLTSTILINRRYEIEYISAISKNKHGRLHFDFFFSKGKFLFSSFRYLSFFSKENILEAEVQHRQGKIFLAIRVRVRADCYRRWFISLSGSPCITKW